MAVSPFIGMDQTYRFDAALPDERLALRIRQAGPEGEALTDRALAAAVLGHPPMSLKVIAAIHWEALRLYLKGVRPARPPEPAAAGVRGDAASH